MLTLQHQPFRHAREMKTLPSIYGALGDIVPDLDSHRDLVLFTRVRFKQLTGGSGCKLLLFLDRCFEDLQESWDECAMRTCSVICSSRGPMYTSVNAHEWVVISITYSMGSIIMVHRI